MQNPESWKPSKFELTKSGLRGARNPEEVSIRSRLITDLIAEVYGELIKKYVFGKLLDLGCREVPLYGTYCSFIEESVCIDWNAGFHSNLHVDIEANLDQGIPVPNEEFDTVLSTDVLEHISKPDLFWSEVYWVLNPGGKVIVGVPFLYWIHEAPFDCHRYIKYALKKYCTNNNLKVIYSKQYGGPAAVVLDIIGKNIPGGEVAAKLFQRAAKKILNIRKVGKVDSNRSHMYPLGYGLVAQK